MKKYRISIFIKLLIALTALVGLISRIHENRTLLLYFTLQSNIWLLAVCVLLAVIQIRHIKNENFLFSEKLTLLQLVFTVTITLTGCVYCMVLVPSFIADGTKSSASVFAFDQLCLHVFTPVLAITDLLAFTPCGKIEPKKKLFSVLPPLFYVIFSLVGFLLSWDFGDGKNYPYFFLNYGSPAGVAGFSSQMPYFMGALYWIILLGLFIIGICAVYIKLVNRRCSKKSRE